MFNWMYELHHDIHITPSALFGERFSVSGLLVSPLSSTP